MPATVVTAQRVRPDRQADFQEWQHDVNRAVARFAGFLGTEVIAPDDEAGEWTVIYRFDSRDHLGAWLASSERGDLLHRGAGIFDGPASQQVLIRERDEDLITVVVSHPVDPAEEEAFLAWQGRVTEAEKAFAGYRGSELFRPVPGVQDEWTAMFRFDTQEHLDAWLGSPARARLLSEGRKFHDFSLRRIASPFGSWFSFEGGSAPAEAPAQWKTALSVLVGLYPTVVLLTLAIDEIWKHGELWASLLVGNIVSVCLLTWVVMPVVTRLLHFWLAPDPIRAGPRLDAIGAAVSVGFLTLAALLFWLITTQIWSLP
ncbi:MAG: antibiotic biosynthesis monooxygenase [Acidimicrobiales bacterium]